MPKPNRNERIALNVKLADCVPTTAVAGGRTEPRESVRVWPSEPRGIDTRWVHLTGDWSWLLKDGITCTPTES
jgi:hypothetical protein